MSRPINNPDNSPSSDAIDEDRVRRALGLKSSSNTPTHQQRPEQARQRHRFATDGSVPVVMLNRTDSETTSLKDRLASAERSLEIERNNHANTRRQLAETKQALQAAQTHGGHKDLSHGEALRTANDARDAAEAQVAALRAEIEQLKLASAAAASAASSAAAPLARQRRTIKAVEPIVRQRRDKDEPQPVRWWTPTYRAKAR